MHEWFLNIILIRGLKCWYCYPFFVVNFCLWKVSFYKYIIDCLVICRVNSEGFSWEDASVLLLLRSISLRSKLLKKSLLYVTPNLHHLAPQRAQMEVILITISFNLSMALDYFKSTLLPFVGWFRYY